MRWEELLEQLAKVVKIPETLDEAKEFIMRDPTCQATIEDLAYKQVVLNILVAAGIVSEQDFNDSIAHFRNVLIEEFAARMLQTLGKAQPNEDGTGIWVKIEPDQQPQPSQEDNNSNNPEDDINWDDDEVAGKA